ncbi:MAG TPA: SHOCT domain-containing protein [Nitrosopumilaceae archaeon]|nr:SHOCT domain-containing protein [Nitrosopumilaceae archaeon]
MRIKLIIIGCVLITSGISGYLYPSNIMSKYMDSFGGTPGSSAMASSVLQQLGIPPLQEIDKWIHYSFVGLAVAGVFPVLFGLFAEKKIQKQFSDINTDFNHLTSEPQEVPSLKSIDILKERLAKGEITPYDFVHLKKLLE